MSQQPGSNTKTSLKSSTSQHKKRNSQTMTEPSPAGPFPWREEDLIEDMKFFSCYFQRGGKTFLDQLPRPGTISNASGATIHGLTMSLHKCFSLSAQAKVDGMKCRVQMVIYARLFEDTLA